MTWLPMWVLICVFMACRQTAAVAAEGVSFVEGKPFACTDYSAKKVFLVGPDGRVSWEYASGTCNDLWVLPSGNLLFNTGFGVREVNRDKQIVFDYTTDSEVYACQRLANGNTFVGECNSGRLIEVASDGQVVKEIRLLPAGANGGHAYMRNARCLANGNYLVAHYGQELVREYDPQGSQVWEVAAPGGPHSVARLPNGHTLIATGDKRKDPSLIEVDSQSRIVWQVGNDDLPGRPLKFLTGFHRLPNGNTLISNWVGHGQFGNAPHLLEITPDKRVVWTYANHTDMRTVSSVQVLNEHTKPLPGEAIH
jgi:hypothetical protein